MRSILKRQTSEIFIKLNYGYKLNFINGFEFIFFIFYKLVHNIVMVEIHFHAVINKKVSILIKIHKINCLSETPKLILRIIDSLDALILHK